MNERKRFFQELRKYLQHDGESKRFISELEDHLEDKSADHHFQEKAQDDAVEALGKPKELALFYQFNAARESLKIAKVMSFILVSFWIPFLMNALFFDEDGLMLGAIPFVGALAFTLFFSFIAWRYPKIGGTFTMIGAAGIFIGVNISAVAFQLGLLSIVFGFVFLSSPFFLLGFLFRRSDMAVVQSAPENIFSQN